MFSPKLSWPVLAAMLALTCTSAVIPGSGVTGGPGGPEQSVSGEAGGTMDLTPPTVVPIPSPSPSSNEAPSVPSAPGIATPLESLAPPGRVMLLGIVSVKIGDPPPGSGLPSRVSASLTDEQGRLWILTFDDAVYRPPGGLLAFNLKRVNVQGKLMAEPDTVLVTSLTLAP